MLAIIFFTNLQAPMITYYIYTYIGGLDSVKITFRSGVGLDHLETLVPTAKCRSCRDLAGKALSKCVKIIYRTRVQYQQTSCQLALNFDISSWGN